MPEIIELTRPQDLPVLSHPERDARNAITKWLAGFRSENTRRAYAKELEAFAAFTKHADINAAAAWLLRLTEHEAHNAVDLWRGEKIARGNKPAIHITRWISGAAKRSPGATSQRR